MFARYHAAVSRRDAAAAQRWSAYEDAVMALDSEVAATPREGCGKCSGAGTGPAALPCARLLSGAGALLSRLTLARETPVLIVQGSRDRVLTARRAGAGEAAARRRAAPRRGRRHSATQPEMARAPRRRRRPARPAAGGEAMSLRVRINLVIAAADGGIHRGDGVRHRDRPAQLGARGDRVDHARRGAARRDGRRRGVSRARPDDAAHRDAARAC